MRQIICFIMWVGLIYAGEDLDRLISFRKRGLYLQRAFRLNLQCQIFPGSLACGLTLQKLALPVPTIA